MTFVFSCFVFLIFFSEHVSVLNSRSGGTMGVWSSDMSVRAPESSKRNQPGRVCREALCRKD